MAFGREVHLGGHRLERSSQAPTAAGKALLDAMDPGESDRLDEALRYVSRLIDGWHAPIQSLVEATAKNDVIRTDVYDRPCPRRLFKGRVVLVGDAAHPMTPDLGQGGCQALEDAVILGACLGGLDDAPRAFGEFQRRRLSRVRSIVRQSYYVGRVASAQGPVSAFLLNLGIRLTPTSFTIGSCPPTRQLGV